MAENEFFDPGWYPGREEIYAPLMSNEIVAGMSTGFTIYAPNNGLDHMGWPPPARTDSIDTVQLKLRSPSLADPKISKQANVEIKYGGKVTFQDVTRG